VEKDRETVGLTPENQTILDDLMSRGWFAQGQDAAKLCVALSIAQGVPVGATSGTDTRWAVGNFDKTGELRALIGAMYPECKTPNRLLEHYLNEGLQSIGAKMRAGNLRLEDLLSSVPEES